MKKNLILTLAFLVASNFGAGSAAAQFPIKVPKLPKVEKPKPEASPSSSNETQTKAQPNVKNAQPTSKSSGSKKIYGKWVPPARPVLLKDSVHIEVKEAQNYWKMPKQSNYTSWIPAISFGICCGTEDVVYEFKYTAEFFNPDGSLWFAKKLKTSWVGADGAIAVEFGDNAEINQLLETKGSVGTGVYSVKIVNNETNETAFQGKFKVGKFLPAYSERTPNKFGFYVDHDWALPVAYVGFHHADFQRDDAGGFPVRINSWIKGDPAASELEAEIFYQGRLIAQSNAASSERERLAPFAAVAPEPRPIWKLWQFTSKEFRFANGGKGSTFNPDNFPGAHYADENPGEYTVKISHKGTAIREIKLIVEPDGKISDGGFGSQLFLTHNAVVVPAKVVGTSEKWNAAGWKTEMFYGNPLTGFNVP